MDETTIGQLATIRYKQTAADKTQPGFPFLLRMSQLGRVPAARGVSTTGPQDRTAGADVQRRQSWVVHSVFRKSISSDCCR